MRRARVTKHEFVQSDECEASCPIHCVHTVTRYEGPMRGNVHRCAECGGECREGR
jgi:hypothetical protein